uniref:DNA distortion polypeptide 3 n=1 Tax=Steinernema glaseri TaxID=37863 RepID=A0A1I7Z9G0_9BILA
MKSVFAFLDKPLSQEEFEYPLAYALLVHTNSLQILFLLSAVYQPQNQFCIAIDGDAGDRFKEEMLLLSECFPNIFVMVTGNVEWCEHSVLRGVFGCVQYLARLKSEWKYFQVRESIESGPMVAEIP